ncbi:metallopeptidase family protein [bacterium]|nr:metallopeptidase family protein [bacterium]NBX98626.1 metallopeptidase family protein [bacterium]NDC94238.1 metallopeptidase family protein [bacterium]NDD84005.1 metallopeptidase family protein [bacterium]NDG29449.1 metallopeptidase family protein [bacterium]
MITVDEIQFDAMISRAMDELPQQYIAGLKNVVIVYEDKPTAEQRRRQNLQAWQTLFGLYEGIPLTQRGNGYNLVLPDKITLFKGPLEQASGSVAELQEHIKRTLWHEIAHYYGLGHDRIHELENKSKKDLNR